MARWTRTQVEQFAPDDRSIKAARKLAQPGPWSDTGSTDTLVWGKCQGSGKTPYQVSVDLTGPAAKCTCPSRKFPCKHGVALLMLWVDGNGSISDAAEAADFASEWAEGRATRTERKQAKAEAPSEPVDPAAAAKRLEKRLELMTAGAEEFETWLGDLYRKGFAAARNQPYSFWEAPAARLTDSQMPGLAQRVRDMPSGLYGDDWADVMLAETGRWFTATRAWLRRDELDDVDRANLRVFLGWATASDDVRRTESISDTWLVEGVHRADDGRVQSQRTWLRGVNTGEQALLLDFAVGSSMLNSGQVVGTCVTAPLAFYPGSGIRRALFTGSPESAPARSLLTAPVSVADAWAQIAVHVAVNPFADEHPVCLQAMVMMLDGQAVVVDAAGGNLPLEDDVDEWSLLAICGQGEVALFGELRAGRFRPLSVDLGDELIPV